MSNYMRTIDAARMLGISPAVFRRRAARLGLLPLDFREAWAWYEKVDGRHDGRHHHHYWDLDTIGAVRRNGRTPPELRPIEMEFVCSICGAVGEGRTTHTGVARYHMLPDGWSACMYCPIGTTTPICGACSPNDHRCPSCPPGSPRTIYPRMRRRSA